MPAEFYVWHLFLPHTYKYAENLTLKKMIEIACGWNTFHLYECNSCSLKYQCEFSDYFHMIHLHIYTMKWLILSMALLSVFRVWLILWVGIHFVFLAFNALEISTIIAFSNACRSFKPTLVLCQGLGNNIFIIHIKQYWWKHISSTNSYILSVVYVRRGLYKIDLCTKLWFLSGPISNTISTNLSCQLIVPFQMLFRGL